MVYNPDTQNYRIKELERKVAGLQRQFGVLNAKHEATTDKHGRRIRDLEIKTAVKDGVPQKRVAEIYDLSAARVNQIVRKTA